MTKLRTSALIGSRRFFVAAASAALLLGPGALLAQPVKPDYTKPQNPIDGTTDKVFLPRLAKSINDLLDRAKKAIENCDKEKWQAVERDLGFLKEHGFDQNYDPTAPKGGDMGTPQPKIDRRRAKYWKDHDKTGEELEKFKKDHPNEYGNYDEFKADKAVVDGAKLPPFPDPCVKKETKATEEPKKDTEKKEPEKKDPEKKEPDKPH